MVLLASSLRGGCSKIYGDGEYGDDPGHHRGPSESSAGDRVLRCRPIPPAHRLPEVDHSGADETHGHLSVSITDGEGGIDALRNEAELRSVP